MLDSVQLRDNALRIATPATYAVEASKPRDRWGNETGEARWVLADHLALIDEAICESITGAGPPILIIEAPPRHGKSELISKYLPSWFLGCYPDKRVMLASYADKLARNFGRHCRDLLNRTAPWFGINGVRRDVTAADEWDLAGFSGGMLTAGVGGPLTGRGADLLIIDDPIKNAEEALSDRVRENHWDWWQSTAYTRLEPGGVAIVMMTRWHEDDLVGRLLKHQEEMEQDHGLQIGRVRLPALAENTENEPDPMGRAEGEALWDWRWPAKRLLAKRATLDAYWWESLYQQRPGQFGKAEWPSEYFMDPFWAEE